MTQLARVSDKTSGTQTSKIAKIAPWVAWALGEILALTCARTARYF